jgi:hypothetical protein
MGSVVFSCHIVAPDSPLSVKNSNRDEQPPSPRAFQAELGALGAREGQPNLIVLPEIVEPLLLPWLGLGCVEFPSRSELPLCSSFLRNSVMLRSMACLPRQLSAALAIEGGRHV